VTRLETDNGACFVELEDVVSVSPPIKAKDRPRSCVVGLRGGHKCYVLYSGENLYALLGADSHGLNHEADALDAKRPPKAPAEPKKKAGRPKKELLIPPPANLIP
jgi:hypothetical protein